MKFRQDENNKNLEINMTPLIDVVFLLLIFFMVSTTFVYTNSLKVNLPKAKGESVETKKNINIVITKQGVITVDGQQVSKLTFSAKLKELYNKNPNATVIIQADRDSRHGDVVFVMDESKKAGYDRFAIAAEEE
ncbi:MAG: biopolymer transporter ExbD [Deferribacterales bacterium]|nr:biopolymer transporter ExbD [Deferribacterales bacterium]